MKKAGLIVFDQLPESMLALDADQLHTVLDGPALIRISGKIKQPLFVTVLQHGNEQTGWLAVRKLLRAYQGRELPREMLLFVSNVAAAREGMRCLDDQPDYNRVWGAGDSDEHQLMREVVERVRESKPFASIDIHNNTGLNPHYACINKLDNQFLQCATLFSRTLVYFLKPDGVQSLALADICPSVTLECGQPGQQQGIEHAYSYLEAMLSMHEIPSHAVRAGDMSLFHTVAVVKVPEHIQFSVNDESAALNFIDNLDEMNFSELDAGTVFAEISREIGDVVLEVTDELGQDVASKYFDYSDNKVRTRVPLMPSMLTQNKEIIRQDCLCYLMERLPYPFVAD